MHGNCENGNELFEFLKILGIILVDELLAASEEELSSIE
jgi:hypothetical protein